MKTEDFKTAYFDLSFQYKRSKKEMILEEMRALEIKFFEPTTSLELQLEGRLLVIQVGIEIFSDDDAFENFLNEADHDISNILKQAKDKKTLLKLTNILSRECEKAYLKNNEYFRFSLLKALLTRVGKYQTALKELITTTENLMNQSENGQLLFDLALLLKIDVLTTMKKETEIGELVNHYFLINEEVRRWRILEAIEKEDYEAVKKIYFKGMELATQEHKYFWDGISEGIAELIEDREEYNFFGDGYLIGEMDSEENKLNFLDLENPEAVLKAIKEDISLVEQCPPLVVEKHRYEIVNLYNKHLRQKIKKSKTQKDYQRVVKKIYESHRIIGSYFTNVMAHHLMIEFKRRKLFIEEMEHEFKRRQASL